MTKDEYKQQLITILPNVSEDIINQLINLAVKLHYDTCEDQKVICSEYAKIKDVLDYDNFDLTNKRKFTQEIDHDSIRYAPNVDFD